MAPFKSIPLEIAFDHLLNKSLSMMNGISLFQTLQISELEHGKQFVSESLREKLIKRVIEKQGTLRVESAFLANSLLKRDVALAPTLNMNLTEINMCILSQKD